MKFGTSVGQIGSRPFGAVNKMAQTPGGLQHEGSCPREEV